MILFATSVVATSNRLVHGKINNLRDARYAVLGVQR